MRVLLASLLVAVNWNMCTGADWCYQTQATCEAPCKTPDHWQHVDENCGKNRQSPINIVTKKTKLDSRLTPFKFTGYQESFSSRLENNGHTVKLTVPPSASATVTGGNLVGTYRAVQLHFHWGENGGPGSEHTIDGEQYPMELHIVHMKVKYSEINEALKDSSGLAVLGFFFEESKSPNQKYDKFIKALKKVINHSASTDISGIALANLIPTEGNMTSYYRYDGSLTTPTCNEAVVWTVFEHPIPLSKEQLSDFSSVKFQDNKPMVNTFRPVQPRKGRAVYYSGRAGVVVASLTLLLVCLSTALGLSQPN